MKKFVKTILVVVALLLAVNTSAQDKPVTFGVKAGVNLSNLGGSGVNETEAKFGFSAGVTVDYAISSDIYLLTGLDFTMKGHKSQGEISGVNLTEKSNPMFLQLPIHLGYKLSVADDTKFVFHAGPYIAYGIAGKVKYESKGRSEDVDFFGEKTFHAFDYGLGLGVGTEFDKIVVGIGYDFGLANLSRNSSAKVKTMNFYLTVGYKL